MSKLIYAIVEEDNKNNAHIRDLGSTAEYTRYTAYLIALSRKVGVTTSKQFAQFYYSYYLNPEWKRFEQYCTRSLPKNKMTWFDPILTDKLKDYQFVIESSILPHTILPYRLTHVDFKPNFDHLSYLAQVELIDSDFNLDNKYRIVNIIKPNKIWKEQSKFNTWEKISNRYSFIYPDLTTFRWNMMILNSTFQISGSKQVHCSGISDKSHTRHLSKDYIPRNYAMAIKKEYNLPCIPKHMNSRKSIDVYDLAEYRMGEHWHRHDSWKNHKFKHQYEQHLVNHG